MGTPEQALDGVRMKRAMTSNVVILIIFLVVFIVLIVGVTPIYDLLSGTSKDETCRLSVIAHSASKKLSPITKQSSMDIRCDRKEVVFYSDHVDVDGKRVAVAPTKDGKKTTKYDALNDYIVNQVLATQLYKCWKQMGAGELNVFNPDFVLNYHFPCVVCAQVSFKDISPAGKYTGLEAYLKSDIPFGGNTTYYNYMSKMQSSTYLTLVGQSIPWSNKLYDPTSSLYVDSNIESSKNYVVYFAGFQPAQLDQFMKSAESAQYLFLSESSAISKCEFLYN
jgi:hypothetical protein